MKKSQLDKAIVIDNNAQKGVGDSNSESGNAVNESKIETEVY